MNWWSVLVQWLIWQGQLGSLQPGQNAESPPFFLTFQDGRSFAIQFKATRQG